jgi:pilus assembly protein CpaC
VARATTGQFPAPEFEGNDVTFSDLLNIFFFHRNEGIGGVLRALNQSGDLQSLAEPNLIAYNGQEAQFLAGGEIPVPVVSGSSGNVSVTYKEFGIRLRFRPTIAGDALRLHVRPEVSTLDFANGVTLAGFRIPALTTRYAETDVELRDGQSFAIAGLLNNVGQADDAAIPILSQIPIIGYLFKSRAQRTEQTELLVLITPRLVRPLNPDEVPPLPTTVGAGAPPATGGLVDAPRPPAN